MGSSQAADRLRRIRPAKFPCFYGIFLLPALQFRQGLSDRPNPVSRGTLSLMFIDYVNDGLFTVPWMGLRKPEFLHPVAERMAADAQEEGGFGLVPRGFAEGSLAKIYQLMSFKSLVAA